MRSLAPLALLLGPLALGACQDPSRSAPIQNEDLDRDSTRTLTISNVRYDHDARTVMGDVRNYRPYPYDNVRVYFDVLGSDRRVLATVADSTATVAPDSTWSFTIPAGADSVEALRVRRYAGVQRGGDTLDFDVMRTVPTPRLTFGQ